MNFKFVVNMSEVSAKLNKAQDIIRNDVNSALKTLAASTHAFVVKKGQEKLHGYALQRWMEQGPNSSMPRNVRWTVVAKDIYVVEIDPSIAWIEEGREEQSMATTDWLLKGDVVPRGKKGVHRAKDGSLYRSIPITQAKGSGSQRQNFDQSPAMAAMIKHALRDNGISLKTIERNPDGSPKEGILHRVDMSGYDPGRAVSGFHSRPRTPAESALSGLKPHEGHFYLGGLAVIQRPEEKAKHGVSREAVTFRTVSTKHQGENRWRAKAVQPLNSIPEAYEYAKKKWEEMLKQLEEKFRQDT